MTLHGPAAFYISCPAYFFTQILILFYLCYQLWNLRR